MRISERTSYIYFLYIHIKENIRLKNISMGIDFLIMTYNIENKKDKDNKI